MPDQKDVTVIVSDLHVGGGASDPGDDHVYQGAEFCKFLSEAVSESRDGKAELFINGDFLEFAQVRPEAYARHSPSYWCSEKESLAKLEAIIDGHKDMFAAMREFLARGNSITLAAGNHDVDLWWPGVQERLKSEVGDVYFGLGKEWHTRYDGRLLIGHGHMIDPANRFERWDNPIINIPGEAPRLEMCPGTLFMVKFVNWLEGQYPFADNLKPITALARLLYTEQRASFKAAAWTLLRFAGEYPSAALGADRGAMADNDIGEQIMFAVNEDTSFAERIVDLFHKMGETNADLDTARTRLSSQEGVLRFLVELVVKLSPDLWLPAFDQAAGVTLGVGDEEGHSLAIIRAGMIRDKEQLREEAISQLAVPGREVVVCGHTHQPDEWRGPDSDWDGGYFNPGSWTRYVDMSAARNLTLEDLRREEDFPYSLNYIRVESSSSSSLRADKVCYKRQEAKWPG